MGTLSGEQIREEVESESGRIAIEPFDPDCIQPASYDMTLGAEAFIPEHEQKEMLEPGSVLSIPAGGTALVLTRERLEVGHDVAGHLGLRSYYTRKGIDILKGPQIDPGFEGPLHVILLNLSPSKQVIPYGEPIVTVEFVELNEPVKEGYDGDYQAQDSITQKEIDDLMEGEGIPLSEAVEAMQNIARDVATLEENVSRLSRHSDWYMRIFITTIVILVASIVGNILGLV